MPTRNRGVRVAALQMCSTADVEENLAKVDALLERAAGRKVTLAVLPENLAIMGVADEDKLEHAEVPGAGPIQDFLSAAARRHGIWLVAGSIPLATDDPKRVYGASLLIDADGNTKATYRKMHLFDVDIGRRGERYRESATMAPGDEPVTADTPAGRLGLTICYDLRFPELYRRLVDDGATIFSVPSAFTRVTGRAHWHSLLRARAIENLSYVIAAAQYGRHASGRETYGHSLIVDPWGRVLAEEPRGDAVVNAVVDVSLVEKLRRDFPTLSHRRLG